VKKVVKKVMKKASKPKKPAAYPTS
jgi:hypothetical protein